VRIDVGARLCNDYQDLGTDGACVHEAPIVAWVGSGDNPGGWPGGRAGGPVTCIGHTLGTGMGVGALGAGSAREEIPMANAVVHFEIVGPDGEALQKYYADLFGWQIDANNPMKYGMVQPIAPGIGGGVGPSQDGSAMVTFYVESDDLKASLDKAESLGGKRVMEPMDIPDGPAIAMFADPQGNVVGLVKGM